MYASPQIKPDLPSLPATGNVCGRECCLRGGCIRWPNVHVYIIPMI